MGKDGFKSKRDMTEETLRALFDHIKAEKKPIGPTSFAELANIDRTYLYRFPVLAAEVAAYGRQTQPKISCRGAGVLKIDARKRERDESIRRQHAQWTKEIPTLHKQIKEVKEALCTVEEQKKDLVRKLECQKRVFELLLMLASEAGVSPVEMEMLIKKVA